MCGILAILQHGASDPPALERLRETARRLRHRGPDGTGIFSADGVGLAHTRLSLVDLSERSNQPFWDETGRYALVYNGELYDCAALKEKLVQQGARFRTTSDTEVLLWALLRLGVDGALQQLEGMFAFALYDRQEQTLVAARDRFGIKPLYLYSDDTVFIVASTVGAMAPWIPVRGDPQTIFAYLLGFNGPTTGRSFYQGVRMVPPGSVIRIKRGSAPERGRYFRLPDLVDPALADSLTHRSEEDVVDEVEHLLLGAVNSQLVADAPVGALCSGGVDSSVIMAMAARTHTDLQVFHADVEGPLSERSAAEHLAQYLGLHLRAAAVRDRDFIDTLPTVVEHFEYPSVVHRTTVPLMLVSQVVERFGVKAVLSGEGSDECYGGYPWLAPNVRATAGRLPRRLLARVRALFGAPPGRREAVGEEGRVRGLAARFEEDLGPEVYGPPDDAPAGARAPGTLASDGELSYILRTLLHRNDTMGMAASIEARFPFLDSRLVRLAVNLPQRFRIRFSPTVLDPSHLFYRDKWIVRRIADRYVPAALSQRHKKMLPTNAFARTLVEDGYFQDSFVRDWFELGQPRLRFLLEGASRALRLRLLGLDVWGRRCLRGETAAEIGGLLSRYVSVQPAG